MRFSVTLYVHCPSDEVLNAVLLPAYNTGSPSQPKHSNVQQQCINTRRSVMLTTAPSHSVQCVPKKHESAAVSRLHTVDTDSRAASKRPYYHATLYAGLVCTPPAVYFRKCNTASSQTKRRLAVTPVRESSPADKDRLTGYKNMRRSHPLLPGKLEIYSILSIRH